MQERELIRRIKEEPYLFQEVYDRYYTPIFSFVIKRSLDYGRSQDITSEVFLKAFIHIQRFEWRTVPLKSWLYKIAVNELRLWHRKRNYRPEYSMEAFGQTLLDQLKNDPTRESMQEEIEKLEQYRTVIEALEQLPERQRLCVSLFYIDNLTYREISEVLGLRIGTAKSNVSRGLQKLKSICNP